MNKPGEKPERSGTAAQASTVVVELRRLRKAGLTDMTLRPDRYPTLTRVFASKAASHVPGDMIGLLEFNKHVFQAASALLPSPELRRAAVILFHADSGATPPPLDERRRLADRAYTGRGYPREPDTIQRYLERDLLDPLLTDILEQLPQLTDQPAAPQFPAMDPLDHEAWSDDLDRVLVGVARQDFTLAGRLLDRWIGQTVTATDEKTLYLRARSLMLMGDVRRDQGLLTGPLSAAKAYTSALGLFEELNAPRRIAQSHLSLALIAEMGGDLTIAAARYAELAGDDRLSGLDRARAQLWVGTAVTKQRDFGHAFHAIGQAMQALEDLDEVDEWSVAQQKLALASLHARDLNRASRHMEIALRHRTPAPLQQVRLDTAHGHVLITDRHTRQAGLAVLGQARQMATRYGLGHQITSIDTITHQAHRLENA